MSCTSSRRWGLCPNLSGQIVMGLVMSPRVEGDDSYPLFQKERDEILASLKRRASTLVDGLNLLEGVAAQRSEEGAMYAFPKVTLPPSSWRRRTPRAAPGTPSTA